MSDNKIDETVVLTPQERYNPFFWQDGIAGPANIVTYNGEDCRGVSFVADDEARKLIIDTHNHHTRLLYEELKTLAKENMILKMQVATTNLGTD